MRFLLFSPRYLAPEGHIDVSVAQVKVIFDLPPALGTYSEPLAYIEHFTPFHQIDPHSLMYRVRRSKKDGYPNAEVIPISRIIRSCHLIPDFGHRAPREWESHTSLQLAPSFLVNPYLSFRDFLLFRYLLPLHIRRRLDSQSNFRPTKRRRLL